MTTLPFDKPVTRQQLAYDLHALGVQTGGIVMVHTALSQLGWVIGGAETFVRALFDVVGTEGTVMAYIGWEDEPPQPLSELPEETRAIVEREFPPYDPLVARAVRDHGRVPELLRTWPGAVHSGHPEAGIVAIGPRAGALAHPHPGDDAYGANTPYARLIAMHGQVLLAGAPLDTTTLIHHAEAIADVPGKTRVVNHYPVYNELGERTWRAFHDIDTSDGALPYHEVIEHPYVEFLASRALDLGFGRHGPVGFGSGTCFEAEGLARSAVEWIEGHFGAPSAPFG
jgi:aminoglycoside 3-N-acetyltransferase